MEELLQVTFNNDSGFTPSEVPLPASNDLPICTDPPTREETAEAIAAMKTNKAAGLDCAITAEALQGGVDQASVVQTLDSAIHRINHYPADKYYGNQLRYPLDSDLSGG